MAKVQSRQGAFRAFFTAAESGELPLAREFRFRIGLVSVLRRSIESLTLDQGDRRDEVLRVRFTTLSLKSEPPRVRHTQVDKDEVRGSTVAFRDIKEILLLQSCLANDY